MMVTLEVRVGGPGAYEEGKQESEEVGVNQPKPVKWPTEEEEETCRQWVQQIHAETRQGYHVHGAIREGGTSVWGQQACAGHKVANQTATTSCQA